MQDDVIHPVEEFGNLPWDKLDPGQCSYVWSYGRGGFGLDNITYHISIPRRGPDVLPGSCDIWILPAPIGAMLDLQRVFGANEVRRNLKEELEAEHWERR